MAVHVTIPRQTRQGVYQLPSVVVPQGITDLRVILNVTTATYIAVGKSVTFRIYWLDEQGVWRLSGTSRWDSGAYTDPETGGVNPVPVFGASAQNLAGRTVRAEVEIPVSMSVGASVETLP